MSGANPHEISAHESEHDELQNFLESSRKSDKKRLSRIFHRGIEYSDGAEKMDPNCRVVITIPSHYNEKHLTKTLNEYTKQDASNLGIEFEIVILVNGPAKIDDRKLDLTATKAYQDIKAFMLKNPSMKITLANSSYEDGNQRIGTLRRDLASIVIQRAIDAGIEDTSKIILITNDADLQDVTPNYVSGAVNAFDKDPNLSAIGGAVDYPYEDFYSDHLFLTVQRFTDVLEIMRRHKSQRFTLRGGNSMFRLNKYVEAGGHKHSRKSENYPLYREYLHEDPNSVAYNRHFATISTSARRQIAALNRGEYIVDRYKKFGLQGDLAHDYQRPAETLRIPETSNKITSPNFSKLLEAELNRIYANFTSKANHAVADIDDSSPEHKNPRDTDRTFERAGFFLGIELSFNNGHLKIEDISRLKAEILKRFDHN